MSARFVLFKNYFTVPVVQDILCSMHDLPSACQARDDRGIRFR